MPDKRGSGKRKRSTSAATGSTDDRAALRARIAELEALEADRERALKIQDALYRIADAASGVHDMAEFYPAIHRIVGELMDADNFYIALYDDEHQTMDYPYAVDSVDVDFPAPGSWEPIGTGQARGTTAYVLRTGRPAHLTLERWEALIADGEIDRLGAPAEDWLGVPLVAEDQRLGVLVVQTYEPGRRYSDADVDLLAFVGQHVATALSRARAIEETRQRNAELAVINSVQGGLAAELDMQAMYDLVGDKIAEIFDTQVVDIGIYDAEADLLHFPYTIERGVRFPDEPVIPFGFRRHVLESGEPLLIDDFERQAAEYQNPSVPLQGEPAKSLVFAPLISGGRSIGVISLQNLDRAHAFDRADLDLLATLTASLSVALENARLLDQTRQRNAELAVINSVQAGLAAELDMQAMYDLVGDKIAEIFDTHVVDIANYDRESDLLHFPYTIERGVRFPDESVVPYGFRRHVLRTAQPLLVDDVDRQAAEYDNPLTPLSGEMPKTAAFAPLISGGVPTGMISLQNLDREHAFGRPELELLNTLAASLSVALENARLIDETRRRAAELAIVNEIGTALSGELEMSAMYELVGQRLRDLFPGLDPSIATYDRLTNLISWPFEMEGGERVHLFEPRELGPGLTSGIIKTARPIRTGTVAEADALGAMWIGDKNDSFLGVPMIGPDGVFGVISLYSYQINAFSEADERLLGTLASNLAVALQSARLFDETRRLLAETDQRAAELAIVNSVGQALASHLDLDALIAQLGDQMVSTFGADLVYVALHDTETDLIEFPYYYEGDQKGAQAPLPFGQGLTSRILQTREPLLLNQAAQFEAIGTRGVGTAASSYLGVPITVGDTAIGVISVQSLHQVGRFGEADTRLLTTLAANVGVAIQNARLFRAQAEGERQYRRLVEELPLVLYTDKPDASGTAIYISPQVETMFGYPQASWFDPPFFASIVHPEDRERVMEQTQWNLGGPDATQSFEYRVIAADGRVVWVHDDVWVVRDESGAPLHVQGFMMDVTEQTLAAAEIRRQKQYFESLVEISPVAVVTMDRGEIVSGWNPAATRLFGYEPDEALGRHIDDLLFPAELREEGQAATRLAAETGRAQLIGRRYRKDGQPVDVEIVSVPLVIDDEHTGYYAIYHDISELEAARAAAEDANQAKSTFLAAMSHEIRTPMNAIIGMSGLLLDTPLSDEQRDYAETITTSGEALLTIINDILDFSKIEAGKIDLEASPFALGACVEGALDMIAPLAATKGVELAYAIDSDLPAVVIGDGGRLRQIVLNLLSNAAKFTERGEIVLRVGGRRLDTELAGGPGRWEIAIEVRDTGIGIPAERMDRLFRSFSQGDLSISRRYGGTGLGLAISRRLAELMDGSLVAESTGIDGQGSLFRVAIRVDAASELDLAPDRAGPLPELVGRKVLVVDDNATNRQILVAQTGRWGIDSRDTASPHEALGWVEGGETFDVALLDLNMPELDGYTLADRIHASASGAATPIVILSSVGSRDRDAPSVAAFLTKPVKPSALHDTLMTVLHGVDKAPAVRLSERPTADPELGRRHPLKILLAEDNAVNQKLAIRLLAQMGYDADIAGNGLEAIAALERTPYDVILMDVQMPELDGLGATRRIRSGVGDRRDVRIVAMTANALAGDREACLEAGMNDYVSKPIRPAELAAALAATPTASSSGGATDA